MGETADNTPRGWLEIPLRRGFPEEVEWGTSKEGEKSWLEERVIDLYDRLRSILTKLGLTKIFILTSMN